MTTSPRMLEDLKSAGHCFAAGAVAASLGGARFYGHHSGARSTRDADEAEFFRGFDAVKAPVRDDDFDSKAMLDTDDEPRCCNPNGHSWVCSGTAYGGDDDSYYGEGRCYCEYCGADGDA